MRVDVNLDVGEQLRGVLDLVDEHRGLVKLNKQGGLVLRHIPLDEIVQRHIPATKVFLLRELSQHSRLSGLTRTGQKDRGISAAQRQYARFQVSADIVHKSPPGCLSADFVFNCIIAEKRARVNRFSANFCFYQKLAENSHSPRESYLMKLLGGAWILSDLLKHRFSRFRGYCKVRFFVRLLRIVTFSHSWFGLYG